MTLYVYALKNRLSGVFEKPVFERFERDEYPELLTQSLALAEKGQLRIHKEYDLYLIGTYDTVTGLVNSLSSADFICSLEPICERYLSSKKGEAEDVRA